MHLITEAAFLGGSLVTYAILITKIMEIMIPKKSIDDYSRMIIGIFATGFTIHLAFEITKIHYYYCIHGNACKNVKL